MNHKWVPLDVPGNHPNPRDVIRTMVCRNCFLRQVVSIRSNGSAGESLSGLLLSLYPTCDDVAISQVLEI